MKKIISIVLIVTLAITLLGGSVLAAGPNGGQGNTNGNGELNRNMHQNREMTGNGWMSQFHGPAEHLNLYPKTGEPDWDVIWDSAWGKLNYHIDDLDIAGVFNGHGLTPGVSYTLVEYLGWPDVLVLGTDVADEDGNVHIRVDFTLETSDEDDYYKIWLVETDDLDLDTSTFITWDYASYLFEYELITPNG